MKKSLLKQMIKEEIKKNLHEGNNTMILDLIEQIHKIINILKKDKSLNKSDTGKLYTQAKPLIDQLHKIIK